MKITSLFKPSLITTAIAVMLAAVVAPHPISAQYRPYSDQELLKKCGDVLYARCPNPMNCSKENQDLAGWRACMGYSDPPTSLDPNRQTSRLPLSTPRPMTHTEIPLQESPGGSDYLPVRVNRTLSVPFALDTGSEPGQIPLDVYLVLMRNGSISPSDGRGSVTLINADGSSRKARRFVIHELKVGDRIVTKVLGTVSSPDTTPLLGQSFLRRLGSYTIDNQRHVLSLG